MHMALMVFGLVMEEHVAHERVDYFGYAVPETLDCCRTCFPLKH